MKQKKKKISEVINLRITQILQYEHIFWKINGIVAGKKVRLPMVVSMDSKIKTIDCRFYIMRPMYSRGWYIKSITHAKWDIDVQSKAKRIITIRHIHSKYIVVYKK